MVTNINQVPACINSRLGPFLITSCSVRYREVISVKVMNAMDARTMIASISVKNSETKRCLNADRTSIP